MIRRRGASAADKVSPMQALLAALSDDLSLPFLQVRSSLEILESDNFSKPASRQMAEQVFLSVENGLQLIEAYKLTLKAASAEDIQFEPVAVGVVLQEVAHKLTPYASKYATDLQVDVSGRLTPVLTHQPSLQIAMQILSASLIRAQTAQVKQKRYKLLLGAHRTSDSVISAGVYSSIEGLSDKTLRSARSLTGKARQPLPSMPPGSASGILIADMLCSSMWQPLRAAAHGGLQGIATAIPISKQLQFV